MKITSPLTPCRTAGVRNRLKDFDFAGIDAADFLELLSVHFSRSVQSAEEIEYQRAVGEPALRIRHSPKGQITAIETLEGWLESDLREIHSLVSDFRAGAATREVARCVVFTNLPLTMHAIGVEDWFQLLPVPKGAPFNRDMHGRYPALLEVAYDRPSLGLVGMRRRASAVQEIELLCNMLYKWGIEIQRRNRMEWGIPVDAENEVSQPFHTIYRWKDMPGDNLAFSDINGYEEFATVAPEKYYLSPDWVYYKGKAVPAIGSDFAELLVRYKRLSITARERLLQAGYWFQYSAKVQTLSRSASFLALVQTVEALVEPVSSGDACPTCSHTPGAVRHFHDFVERYASATPKKDRDAIYRMRSRIVHSGRTLRTDISPFDMHPAQFAEDDLWRMLNQLVRLMLRNWLADTREA